MSGTAEKILMILGLVRAHDAAEDPVDGGRQSHYQATDQQSLKHITGQHHLKTGLPKVFI